MNEILEIEDNKIDEKILGWKKIEHDGVLTFWSGTLVNEGQEKEVKEFFKSEFKIEITPVGCVHTLPDEGETLAESGGRCDFFFYVNLKDIPSFAIARLEYGMRWWEDVYFNKGENIYPRNFLLAYPDGDE